VGFFRWVLCGKPPGLRNRDPGPPGGWWVLGVVDLLWTFGRGGRGSGRPCGGRGIGGRMGCFKEPDWDGRWNPVMKGGGRQLRRLFAGAFSEAGGAACRRCGSGWWRSMRSGVAEPEPAVAMELSDPTSFSGVARSAGGDFCDWRSSQTAVVIAGIEPTTGGRWMLTVQAAIFFSWSGVA